MNQKWLGMRVFVGVCVAIGWLGVWYPEVAEEAGVYTVVMEDGTVQKPSEVVKCELNEYTYIDLLEMDSSNIHFRSRLLEWIEEYFKKVRS